MISQGVGTSPSNGQILGDIGFSSYSDGQTNTFITSEGGLCFSICQMDTSSAPTDLAVFYNNSF